MDQEKQDLFFGALYTGGIIVLFLLVWVLWICRRSKGAGSRVAPILRAARAATKAAPRRWSRSRPGIDKDLEKGNFSFCTEDGALKGSFLSKGLSATLVLEYRGSLLKMGFREGKLIGMTLDQEDFDGDHWEVRCNAPLARHLLDDVRGAVGFMVVREEVVPKAYSKEAEQRRKAKEEADRTPPKTKRKKRDA